MQKLENIKHHYVPEWYQRLFIPPGAKSNNLLLRDLTPERIAHPDGGHHYQREVRFRGPNVSFCEENLYRLNFGKQASDIIEKNYFGMIDADGSVSVRAMADFEFQKVSGNHLRPFVRYLDAQKLRTPKGLDYLKAEAKTDHDGIAVVLMHQLSEMHSTIWVEGVWEIFRCDHTVTKLIISDHPVTVYNRQIPPTDPLCRYPYDPGIDLIGTQTLFPLRPDRLLVLSNLQFARNHWLNGKVQRLNPRMRGDTIKFLGNILTGRQLNEGEIRAVNYVIMKRAKKFIAASNEEWLYPEHNVKTKVWSALGGEFFLRPDPRAVGFQGEMYASMKGGSTWGMDEFGRPPNSDDPARKAERDAQWESYVKSSALWDAKRGPPSQSSMP